MNWIKTIAPVNAQGRPKKIYDRIAGAGGQVDHVLQVRSLRPHTLERHLALYKSVLHHSGMKQLRDDNKRADAICDALLSEEFT